MQTYHTAVFERTTLAQVEAILDRHTQARVPVTRWTAFSWSVSRHQTYQQCKRRYYLTYYGARRVREANNKVVSAVWWLKQVRSHRSWIGSVVHEIAARAVRALRDGTPMMPPMLAAEALDLYRRGVEASRRGAKLDREWVCLMEHTYPDASIPADPEGQITALVSTLLDSPTYRALTQLDPAAVLEVDEPFQSFEVEVPALGPVRAFAIPDVLVDEGDGLRIIDWKTGDTGKASIREQAGIYRMYAARTYEHPGETVTVDVVDLAQGGQTVAPPGGTPTTEEAHEFMMESIGMMVDTMEHPTYNTAAIRDFPMTEDTNICERCPFKRVCWRHDG